MSISAGLKHTASLRVASRHTVPEVEPDWPGFRDMPAVLATAMMIGFVEQTCIEGLRPFLDSGQRTVGTHVDISHLAATAVGMTLTVSVELIEVQGRSLLFRVECHDEGGLVGDGIHRRAIVDQERFLQRLAEKVAAFK